MAIFTKYSPLALAVATLLSVPAFADDSETVHADLGTLKVTFDRQGAKVKTNVVTTAIKDESTATDLRGLLKGEPSINFSGGNGASQFITIRGMGQNSIDVKVDNTYSDSQMFYHQGRFNLDPSLVKIVSVQKGAGGASAGIGQTNGAIVAKTVDAQDLLKGSDKDWGLKVNAGYSSNNEQSFGLTGFGKSDKLDFVIATNRIDQQDYKGGKDYVGIYRNNVVPFSSSDKESHLYKLGYNLNDNHRFVLSHFKDSNKGVRSIREEFDIYDETIHQLNCPRVPNPRDPSQLQLARDAQPQCRLSVAGQAPEYRELYTKNTNLEWIGSNLGFADEATANIYVMKNERDSSGDANSYAGIAKRNTASVTTKGANINFDSTLNDKFAFLNNWGDNTLLKYGLNYRHQEITPNARPTNYKDTEKTDTGLYVEAIHDVGQFTLTGGLRYDRFSYTAVTGKTASDSQISPSLGVIYQATPTLSFNASHNHATRSPRLVDAFLSGGRASTTSIADDIKAERAKNTEIGFNYNDGTWSVNGSVFRQEIDDLINSGRTTHTAVSAGGTTTTVNVTEIDNVGRAENKGWELNASYRHQNLTTRLGVADSKPKFYTDAGKVGNNGNPIEFTNREYGAKMGRIWTAGLAYRLPAQNLEIGLNHRLAQKVTGIAWQNGNQDGVRDGYNATDIYANWKPYGNDKMNVNFAVNNIGDKLYRPHNAQGLPATGREFRVGFNFTY